MAVAKFENKQNIVETPVIETPLVTASKNGILKEVRHLVEEVQVNVEQRSIIWWEDNNFSFHGSALHAAVINGQMQVITYLIDCGKANINAKTKSVFENDSDGGSTALHLAVSHLRGDKQKEIFTYLLSHGADWTIVDEHGQQCWERAGDFELTKLLIEFRVGCYSSRNAKSSTIAHKWAKSLHPRSARVISLAIDKGININEPDNEGSTPLMIASIGVKGKPNKKVVEVILNQLEMQNSRFERIIAFELMGATLISNDDFNGWQHMKSAMELRINEPPILKPPLADDIKTAFNVTSEVQTMNELENVAHDLDFLQVQAHLIRLRILGLQHNETMRCLVSHALRICSRKPQTFLNIFHLILKKMELTERRFWFEYCSKMICLSLLALTRAGDCMPPATFSTFDNAMPILRKLVTRLKKATETEPYAPDFTLDSIVSLTHVMLDGKPLTAQERIDLKCCLSQAVSLCKRNTDGLDLFLLACSKSKYSVQNAMRRHEQDDEIDDILSSQRFDSDKTISIFIEVGSDVHSVSNEGDTAFHVLAKNIFEYEFEQCIPLFDRLYQAGVHVDQTNSRGETIMDILRDRGIPYFHSSIMPTYLLEPSRLK